MVWWPAAHIILIRKETSYKMNSKDSASETIMKKACECMRKKVEPTSSLASLTVKRRELVIRFPWTFSLVKTTSRRDTFPLPKTRSSLIGIVSRINTTLPTL